MLKPIYYNSISTKSDNGIFVEPLFSMYPILPSKAIILVLTRRRFVLNVIQEKTYYFRLTVIWTIISLQLHIFTRFILVTN